MADDVKERRIALGELLERVMRRLHDEWHDEWDEKEGAGDERQADADRALELLGVLYPDLKLTATHKPAEDDEKRDVADEEDE